MKTITFFSYKGGVGRSMALLNTAWEMACLGKRVGIIDFDLEAPGLSLLSDFNPKKKPHPKRYGLTDLVEDRIKAENEKSPPPKLESYGHLKNDVPEFKKFGSIFLLSSGRVEFPISKSITKPLSGIQNDFQKELQCEYLFVDSRTGLSDVIGITTVFLPDLVFVILGLNQQNIEGTMEVLKRLKKTKFTDYAYLVPSLIPVGSDELVEEAYQELKERLTGFGIPADRLLIDLALHYHPYLAVRDTPVIGKGVANILDRQYKAIAQKIIDLNPEDPRHKIKVAKSLVENKDYQQALRLVGPVANRPEFAEDIEFLRLYGRICIETKNWVTADDVLSRALKIEEKSGKDKEENRTIKTALLYAEFLKIRSINLYVSFLGKARFFKGTNEERRTIYQLLSDAYDKELKDPLNFIKINEEIAKKDPTVAGDSAYIRANFYQSWGREKDALEVFKKEIDHFPKDADGLGHLYYYFGKFLVDNKKWKEALDQYLKALEYLNREEAILLHLRIAELYWDHFGNEKELAITHLKKAIETCGNDERLLNRLASYYYTNKDLLAAIECRKKRMEIAPWDRLVDINDIALMSSKLGIPTSEDYASLIQKEIKQKSGWHVPYIAFALSYVYNKDFVKAAEIFETGARQCASTESREAIADKLDDFRKHSEAIDIAIEVLKKPIFKKTPKTNLYLSGLYVRKRDWVEALKYARKYIENASSTDVTDGITRVSELLRRMGKIPDALELLKEKLRKQEENIRLHKGLVRALKQIGHSKEALKELDVLEKKTGKYYINYILEERVRIWAAHLDDTEQAGKIIGNAIIENSDNQGIRGSAANCYEIIGEFDKTIEICQNFKYYGNEEMKKSAISMLARNLFDSGFYQKALSEVEYFEEKYDKDIDILFVKLQSHEALDQPVQGIIKEIEDHYAQTEAIDCDWDDLRNIIRLSLRNKDQLKRAEEFVGWIDDHDIPMESTKLRSCEALYYLCTGKQEEGLSLLHQIIKLGYFHEWVPRLLHDLNVLGKIYDIKPNREEIFKIIGKPAQRYSHLLKTADLKSTKK